MLTGRRYSAEQWWGLSICFGFFVFGLYLVGLSFKPTFFWGEFGPGVFVCGFTAYLGKGLFNAGRKA